jgi:hypothetical protein
MEATLSSERSLVFPPDVFLVGRYHNVVNLNPNFDYLAMIYLWILIFSCYIVTLIHRMNTLFNLEQILYAIEMLPRGERVIQLSHDMLFFLLWP